MSQVTPSQIKSSLSLATCTWKRSRIRLTLQKKIDDECSIVHETGLPCSARPQRSHRIFFGDPTGSRSKCTLSPSLPPPLSLSHFLNLSLSFSVSLSLSPTHLSLYYLLCSKKAPKFKNRHSLTCLCLGKVMLHLASPQIFFAAPTSLGPHHLRFGPLFSSS